MSVDFRSIVLLLQLWVSPVKLVVGKGNLLSQIYRLLGLHGRFGSSGSHHQQPWLSSSSSGSSTAAAAAKEAAAAAAEDGSAVRGVEVWSGPLRVTLEGPGKFRTDRVDMILGALDPLGFCYLNSAAAVALFIGWGAQWLDACWVEPPVRFCHVAGIPGTGPY